MNNLYLLDENVRLVNDKLYLGDIHLFDCNSDSIILLNILIDARSKKTCLSIEEIIELIPNDKLSDSIKKNQKIIGNVVYYLNNCKILNKINEKVVK